jgi:hypothetical protein
VDSTTATPSMPAGNVNLRDIASTFVPLNTAFPIVNLNGSAKGELLDQQLKVLSNIDHLLGALSTAYPHGRDFQLNQSDYERAVEIHKAEVVMLRALRERHEALVNHIHHTP